MPIGINEFYDFMINWDQEDLLDKIRYREDLGHIDLLLKDNAFEDLEILCSPYMSNNSKKELSEILDQYASNTVVKNSRLKMKR